MLIPIVSTYDWNKVQVNVAYAELIAWANEELEYGNRLKASRLYRVADQLRRRVKQEKEKSQ